MSRWFTADADVQELVRVPSFMRVMEKQWTPLREEMDAQNRVRGCENPHTAVEVLADFEHVVGQAQQAVAQQKGQ